MSLTVGKAPFGQHPDGSFDFEAPTHVVHVERFPRRVRGLRDGKTVIDSNTVVELTGAQLSVRIGSATATVATLRHTPHLGRTHPGAQVEGGVDETDV